MPNPENEVVFIYNIIKDIDIYPVYRNSERKDYPKKDVYVEVGDWDYYGSSLSRMDNREDYDFFTIEINNVPVEIKDGVKEEADTYMKKGWNRKYDAIATKRFNWQVSTDSKEETDMFINALYSELRNKWGENVIISAVVNEVRLDDKSYYTKRFNKAIIRFVVGLRHKGLPSKGEAPDLCKDCMYFEMAGIETSHEWIEFYPYCNKMHRSIGEVGSDIKTLKRSENCPIA